MRNKCKTIGRSMQSFYRRNRLPLVGIGSLGLTALASAQDLETNIGLGAKLTTWTENLGTYLGVIVGAILVIVAVAFAVKWARKAG